MKKFPALLLSCVLTLVLFACNKAGKNAAPPEITFQGMSKDSVVNGASDDTVLLQIYIKDDNGDLASDAACFFMDDLRDTAGFIAFTFPKIEDAILNNPKGIEGNIFFFVTGDWAVVREDSLHQAAGDTVQYEFYVQDAAGQASNRITIPPIYIKKP